jgi:hypothetical protein
MITSLLGGDISIKPITGFLKALDGINAFMMINLENMQEELVGIMQQQI